MAAVGERSGILQCLLPFVLIHGNALHPLAEFILNAAAVIAVGHRFAPAQIVAIRRKKGHPHLKQCGKVVQQRLNFITQKEVERHILHFFLQNVAFCT